MVKKKTKSLDIEDIVDQCTGLPAVIACHGPSLNSVKDKILDLQNQKKLIRFSLNNWFDFFDSEPDYWVLASTVDTIKTYTEIMNKSNVPVFFADTVDKTSYSFIENNLKCDYIGYDQRHFKGHTCTQILQSFYEHNTKEDNHDFAEYGNNIAMWQPPRYKDGAGFALPRQENNILVPAECCERIQNREIMIQELWKVVTRPADLIFADSKNARLTIQEVLQSTCGHEQHYSTGDTVALHAIAFAIIMGCNPIYIAGMDLDYGKGYAENEDVPVPVNNDWSRLAHNLKNDLRILDESARLRGTKIINLNKETWYHEFEKGELL
jgi:hypothetical protein